MTFSSRVFHPQQSHYRDRYSNGLWEQIPRAEVIEGLDVGECDDAWAETERLSLEGEPE